MLLDDLLLRSDSCELCESRDDLDPLEVGPGQGIERAIVACAICRSGIATAPAEHWRCLQGAIWSEVPAVQVHAYRLLGQLAPTHSWAADALEQAYLDDELLRWAEDVETVVVVVDSNGTPLSTGDAVTLIKDLSVKGANFTAKRGTMVKNIRVGDDPTHVEGRVNKIAIMLKTCFLRKA